MNSSKSKRLYRSFLSLIIILSVHFSYGQIKLPKHVGDGMVLQRNAKVKIWGWADAGEKVKVRFNKKNYSANSGNNGKWQIMLPTSEAGGPYTMVISGKSDKITINNILVGDVWICAGQSNMVHYLGIHQDRYKQDIENSTNSQIRQFLVPTNAILTGPADDVSGGEWKEANPENILRFSVVGYFFAKKLYDEYQVPIGIINSSVGGTPIEAWTSEEGLTNFPYYLSTIEKNKDTAYVNSVNREASLKRQQSEGNRKSEDKGLSGPIPWYSPDYFPKSWDNMNIPGYWEDQGIRDLNGSVWFRKVIEVPASMVGKPARIDMGRIIDADHVYINGKLVGNKTYQYPQRRYEFEAGILKEGKNLIVVQAQNFGGKGGFVPDKPYYLAAGEDTIDLKGYWKYKVGEVYELRGGFFGGISAQNQPSALFNGMIAPFTDYPVKGFTWYQGESNAGRPQEYEKLMPAIIHDWRQQWNNENLPFIYAQLPNFLDVNYLPEESNWAELREAQRKALNVPNTAMAVALNLGEWNDIHPDRKKPIGDRMALAAQKLAYGDNDVVYSGPLFSNYSLDGNKVTLHFDHIGNGLVSNDGEDLRWFAIAGEDREFVWAKAEIEGDNVIVWNEEIKHPAYVRYAWSDNPDKVNLFNKEGLPASPFEVSLIDEDALWHGKKAAVVLTYDDALEFHLDNAIPALDKNGFKGTFYITANFPGLKKRIKDWEGAAKNGHELGNHTLFHPCDASKEGREWVNDDDDLSKYSISQMDREVEATNLILNLIDGKSSRTFAYTCGDLATNEGSFINTIKDKFVALRGVRNELNKIETLDFTNINCYMVDNNNTDQMISWAEKAKEENALLVLLFHGVGGGHDINIDLEKHNDFVKYLKDNQPDYWVTTLLEASENAKKVLSNQGK